MYWVLLIKLDSFKSLLVNNLSLTNKSKSIKLVSDNQDDKDYYVQINLNVGYAHNELALTNQISNDFAPGSLEGNLSIIAYVNGVEVESFPTEPNYETGITCLYKSGNTSDARGVFRYSAEKGWEVDIFGLNRSLTTCRVDFTEVLKVTYEVLSTRYDCANVQAGSKPTDSLIKYTGNCTLVQDTENTDGTHTWRMKLLTSGELSVEGLIYIDAFLVGGGGGGGGSSYSNGTTFQGGGGGGGYTLTQKSIRLDNKNGSYSIVIGAGGSSGQAGSSTTAFGYKSNGGEGGTYIAGGAGGSGGGGGGYTNTTDGVNTSTPGAAGGSYGSNGETTSNRYTGTGGTGQGTTTCEFGEGTTTSCDNGDSHVYSGGGGGAGRKGTSAGGGTGGTGGGGQGHCYGYYGAGCTGSNGTDNTGGGGGGTGKTGGSGIVVIRDVRS